VARVPAGTRDRGPIRPAVAEPWGDKFISVELIGHAGMAIDTEGGSPTRGHLDDALDVDVDRLELDLCSTADGHLVMRHDTCVADNLFVGDLELAQLRVLDTDVLTIDEVIEYVGDRVPILLDIKMARAAELLGIWLRRRRDLDCFALCTENLPWLLHLRFAAPRVARWPSFPNLGERRAQHVQRVIGGLWRSHSSLGGLFQGVADVHRAARQIVQRPQESLARLAGLPWRGRLPGDLGKVCDDVMAAGLCVHHWMVSDDLIDEAHRRRLHVNAWTVNNPFAARAVAAAGVDSITTDRVSLVRMALCSQPPQHAVQDAAPRVRGAARIVPS
jgi:glycerophosphoryl diester phosphodiesterase